MKSAAPLNVAIAGLGRLGRRHAECLAHHVPGARLVAACNPSAGAPDWARDQLGGTALHQDFNPFITTADLDPVVLARNASGGALDWAGDQLGVTQLNQDFNHFIPTADIDAVVLASPTTDHAHQFEAALRAGKHVFVEKPLSLDVATCEALAALAAAHPAQVVMVGFERRFDPDLVRARAAIERGELGRPFLVRSQTCDRIDPDGFFVKFAPTS